MKCSIRDHEKSVKRKKKPFRIKNILGPTLSAEALSGNLRKHIKGSPKKKKLDTHARNKKSQGKPVIVRWKIRYGAKHKVKFKRVKFCDIRFMTKHKVKFKKVEFCRVKLMKWALKKSSFRNHILMGKLAQESLMGLTVPNKKMTLLSRYLNLARNYSQFRRQKVMLTTKIEKKFNLRPKVQFGEALQQNSMVKNFKHHFKGYITPPPKKGGLGLHKKTKLKFKKGGGNIPHHPTRHTQRSQHGC